MDPTERFSDRVDDYDRYRPRYPDALFTWLGGKGMGAGTVVADVGAGTGILAEPLLDLGCHVVLVEPNRPMLERAHARLGDRARASFVAARAEATGLSPASVDWVTVGQAFHWFDADRARRELGRILRPGGRALLVWNDRRTADPFMAEYERLLETWGVDFIATTWRHQIDGARIEAFFGGRPERIELDHAQSLDREGLVGRTFSSSYMPARDHPRHGDARADALALFDRWQQGGAVTLRYDTIAFLGRLR